MPVSRMAAVGLRLEVVGSGLPWAVRACHTRRATIRIKPPKMAIFLTIRAEERRMGADIRVAAPNWMRLATEWVFIIKNVRQSLRKHTSKNDGRSLRPTT